MLEIKNDIGLSAEVLRVVEQYARKHGVGLFARQANDQIRPRPSVSSRAFVPVLGRQP